MKEDYKELQKDAEDIRERIEFEEKKQQENEIIKLLRESYYLILDCFEDYMDMNDKIRKLISVWVIGSCIHNCFDCFPYLYFNAMRGSGKTRLMKMVCFFNKGILTTAPTEAVLFRDTSPLAIDEFERMDAKEKLLLKEMLNTAYKKGLYVLRTTKKKVQGEEKYVVDKFETFRAVCMANIWGMDDVLGDRAIQSILEKSDNPLKTKKMELFELDENMQKVKNMLNRCSLCSVVMSGNIRNFTKKWNFWVNNKYKTTQTTYNTYNTYITQTTLINTVLEDKLFLKIDETELNGRTLELFFPLFIISNFLGEEVLEEILGFAKEISEERKSKDIENKDVLLYRFVSECEGALNWSNIKELTNQFKLFLGEDDEEWVNPKWFGRALKRLNLIVSHRRVGRGSQVILNVTKAIEKSMMFREKDVKD